MGYAADFEMDRPGGLFPPLAISLLVHGLLALLFLATSLRAPEPAATPFDVQILQPGKLPIAPPKKQIVAPSDAPEQKPDQTELFSDRDSRAVEETIRHGEPAPPAKPPAEASSKPSTPSTKTAPPLGLGDLFVRPSELARDPALLKGESADGDKTADGGKRDLAMLDRPDLWADPGPRGSADYLPNVRDGNLTMLNAKADRFAPFVRRVGLRVFQGFSMQFKSAITSGRVPQGRDAVEVEAVMDRDGKRVDVFLKQHDGDLGTDRILLGNLNAQMFFDKNPPAEAVAADGRIHFVFALNALVSHGEGRGGGQAGARWVMGAGLL